MEAKGIAITIQNLVQFYSLKPGIDKLKKMNYMVDIYVPSIEDSSGFGDMFNDTYKELIKMGYNIQRNLDPNTRYKILLEPYPMDAYYKFNYKYRIKYRYSLLSAKPNLVYIPESNIYYDAILCFGPYEAEYLKAYSNIEVIGNLKYIDFQDNEKNKNINKKKTLLYLPTYGNVSSIDSIIEELEKLKNNYYIIAKFHHGTSFLTEESERVNKLNKAIDEVYDHRTELVKLLKRADVVLSDNSGAIFETIYAKVPIALYAETLNDNKIKNFNTIQFNLVDQGYIPYTNKVNNISTVIEQALMDEYTKKQLEIRNKLFYFPKDPLETFIKVIEKYLNDDININYKNMHDVLIENYNDKINLINEYSSIIENQKKQIENKITEIQEKDNIISNQQKEINKLLESNKQKENALEYYNNGKLYKICKKIYKLKNGD